MLGYFLRHGQTDANVERRISGHSEVSLNEEGIRQLLEIRLPEECTHIVSSDLVRCRETVAYVNRAHLPVRYDPRLREKGFGSLEGMLWSEADPTGVLWEANKAHAYDYRPDGGEHVDEVEARLFEALRDIARESATKGPPLIVTHSGVMRLLTTRLGDAQDTIGNGAIYVLRLPESDVV